MIDLTNTTEVVKLLNRAVAEKGADYEYPRAGGECIYFEPNGTPSCIVGHVLAYKGAKRDDIIVDGQDLNSGDSVYSLSAYEVVKLTDETKSILVLAQRNQDDGYDWGTSVTNAIQGIDY